jgi:hypothetical protein
MFDALPKRLLPTTAWWLSPTGCRMNPTVKIECWAVVGPLDVKKY